MGKFTASPSQLSGGRDQVSRGKDVMGGGRVHGGGGGMVIDQKRGKLIGWVEGKQVDLLRDNLLGIPTRLK